MELVIGIADLEGIPVLILDLEKFALAKRFVESSITRRFFVY